MRPPDAHVLVRALTGRSQTVTSARAALAEPGTRWWADAWPLERVREDVERRYADLAWLPEGQRVPVPGFEQMLLDLRATGHRELVAVHLVKRQPGGGPDQVWELYLTPGADPDLVAACGPTGDEPTAPPPGVPARDPWTGVDLAPIGFRPEHEAALRAEGPSAYARALERQRAGGRFVCLVGHPDDTSDGEPERWLVLDPRDDTWLLEGTYAEVEAAFAAHPDWVELEVFLTDG